MEKTGIRNREQRHCYRTADLHLHFHACSYISCLEGNEHCYVFGHFAVTVVKMTLLRVTSAFGGLWDS